MSVVRPKLNDYHDVGEALADLCQGLCDHDLSCMRCHEVAADQVPPPFRELLVHHNHMTTTLQAFHGAAVDVRVLEEQRDGDFYRRRIVLTLSGSDRIVEFGIVRIDLSLTGEAVRKEILEQKVPLGDILSTHDILRRIEPRWYLRVSTKCPLFQELSGIAQEDVYGRVGTIYCNERPAIELLEIVTGDASP